jgi:hypothetical protein
MMHIECLDNYCYRIMATVDDDPSYAIGYIDETGSFFPEKKVYDVTEAWYISKGIEEIKKIQNEAKHEGKL